MKIISFLLMSFFALQASSAPSAYQEVLQLFQNASPRVKLAHLESEAMYGRCFRNTDPEQFSAAALVGVKSENDGSTLLGFLWSESETPDYFDQFGFEDLLAMIRGFVQVEFFPEKTIVRYNESRRSYLRKDDRYIYEMYIDDNEKSDVLCFYFTKGE
jgi:hypothetical protein